MRAQALVSNSYSCSALHRAKLANAMPACLPWQGCRQTALPEEMQSRGDLHCTAAPLWSSLLPFAAAKSTENPLCSEFSVLCQPGEHSQTKEQDCGLPSGPSGFCSDQQLLPWAELMEPARLGALAATVTLPSSCHTAHLPGLHPSAPRTAPLGEKETKQKLLTRKKKGNFKRPYSRKHNQFNSRT